MERLTDRNADGNYFYPNALKSVTDWGQVENAITARLQQVSVRSWVITRT